MSLIWMDGCVFTKLSHFYLHRIYFDKALSVGLPVCTHIKYVDGEYYSLQSIFHVPTLIELVNDESNFLGSNDDLQLLPTRTLLLRRHLYNAPESLVAGIASLVELEVLKIDFYLPYSNVELLTALGRTIADIGVPALRSAHVTLDRDAVDEYGEGADTSRRGSRSLICPNLRQFALRIRDASASERKEIGRECKQMVDTRRRAGQELECCRIWWDGGTTPSVVLDTSSDGFEVKW